MFERSEKLNLIFNFFIDKIYNEFNEEERKFIINNWKNRLIDSVDVEKKKLVIQLVEEVTEFIEDSSREYERKLEEKEEEKKLEESLKIETEKGYKYIIDNKLTYYYRDKEYEERIYSLNFKEIFEESINNGYVSNITYENIKKFLGNDAVKYFYYKFKVELLEQEKKRKIKEKERDEVLDKFTNELFEEDDDNGWETDNV